MDMAAVQLLKTILSNNSVSSPSLETKFNLSKGQLDYRIRKINEELETAALGEIRKEGFFYSIGGNPEEVEGYLAKVSPTIHFSSEERIILLYLIILLGTGETLETIGEKLFVSKNTILKDKKKLQAEWLSSLKIGIDFSRRKGFFLTGNEVEIRKMGIRMIREIEKKKENFSDYLNIIEIDRFLLKEIKEGIYGLERVLTLEFTEMKITDLYLISYMCSIRSKHGYPIKKGEIGDYVQMVEKDFYSKVYDIMHFFFKGKSIALEIHFISIQLLGTSLIKTRSTYKDTELVKRIRRFISNFEFLGITDIENKIHLEEALYQHIIPAYYRIKFGLPDNELLTLDSIENYEFVHPLVKDSIGTIEEYLGIAFPEGELIYISIILLSVINEELDKKERKERAIVICQQGVSVSKLLFGELKQLFDDIEFVQNMSLKEFYKESIENIDIVFSTVPVQTNKELFIIRPLLTEADKLHIKNEVHQRINFDKSRGHLKNKELIENVIHIVKKNIKVFNEEKLVKDLQKCILSSAIDLEVRSTQEKDPEFIDLLPSSHIQIYPKAKSVEEAIRIAGKPLVKEGYVSSDYIKKIIANYDPKWPYWVISEDVAIPHAGPNDGVYKVGMSLLKLDKPVRITEDIFISIFIVIAPQDKKKHIKAVTRLYELVKEKDFITVMKKLQYEKDIHNFLKTMK